MSNEDVKTLQQAQTTALAVAGADFEADAGAGFENADKDSFAVPFMRILQSLSPQVRKSEPQYIEGAEEGVIFNTVTSLVVDGAKGIKVIPCHFRRAFVEWKPRNSGGGFVAEHPVDSNILLQTSKNEKGQDELPNGNIVQDTRYHYVLVVNDEGFFPALIAMTSSQLKKSKRWLTLMDGIKFTRADGSKFTPSTFSHIYTLTTTPEKNEKGSFFNWQIETHGKVELMEHYQAAKSFRDAISKGVVKASDVTAEAAGGVDPEIGF